MRDKISAFRERGDASRCLICGRLWAEHSDESLKQHFYESKYKEDLSRPGPGTFLIPTGLHLALRFGEWFEDWHSRGADEEMVRRNLAPATPKKPTKPWWRA